MTRPAISHFLGPPACPGSLCACELRAVVRAAVRTALRAAVSAVLARVFVRACSCLCGSLRAIVYALGGSSGWVSIVACRLF